MKSLTYKLLSLTLFLCLAIGLQAQEVKKVDVSVEDKDGYKKITIKKHLEDGSMDVINWEGSGEIPEKILKELGEGGGMIFIHKDGDQVELLRDGEKLHSKNIEVIIKTDDKEGKELFFHKDGNIHKGEDGEFEVIVEKVENIHLDNEKNVFVIRKEGEQLNKNIRKHIVIIRESEKEIELHEEGGETDDNKEEVLDLQNNVPKIMERSLPLEDFRISPNPSNGAFNVRFQGEKAPLTIRAFDAQGREVYKEFNRDFGGTYNQEINIDDVNTDMLFLTIEQEGKRYTDKVVIKK